MQGPFVISVAEVSRHPGTRREVYVEGPMSGLGLSSAAVPENGVVTGDLVLEAIGDGAITVTGVLRAPWTGECRRCLRPVEGDLEVDVREIFERHATEGETYPLDGEHLNLEPLVRDALLLGLPLAPLCGPDCLGPDPDGYAVAVEADGDADGTPVDPRWAALDDLRFD